jgi:hypothetical protein
MLLSSEARSSVSKLLWSSQRAYGLVKAQRRGIPVHENVSHHSLKVKLHSYAAGCDEKHTCSMQHKGNEGGGNWVMEGERSLMREKSSL